MIAPATRKRRITAVLIGAAAAAVLSLSACGQGSQPGGGGSSGGSTGDSSPVTVIGEWGSDEKGQPRLELYDDNTATGHDGCNGFSTTYELEGETATFGDLLSTMKACQGVDTWLSKMKTATLEGETLVIMNAKGEEIGTLERAE
ncbi:hypothetical protein GCM10027416_19020 [Okibacterium endophyticum]